MSQCWKHGKKILPFKLPFPITCFSHQRSHPNRLNFPSDKPESEINMMTEQLYTVKHEHYEIYKTHTDR